MSKHISADPTQTLVVRMTASGIGSCLHSPRTLNRGLIIGFLAFKAHLTLANGGSEYITTGEIVQYMHQSSANVLRLLHSLKADGKITSRVNHAGGYCWRITACAIF